MTKTDDTLSGDANNNENKLVPSDEVEWLPDFQALTTTEKAWRGDSRFKEDHYIAKLLGKGAFGKVYLTVRKRNGEKFAVKEIEIGGDTTKDKALEEATIHSELKHINIVLYDTHWLEFGSPKTLYICMEFCANGTLRDAIEKRLSRVKYWKMARELVEGIDSLHRHGIVHCDLKPDNILLDGGNHVKLGDFGNARRVKPVFEEGSQRSIVFSEEDAYLVKCDLDALGPILFDIHFASSGVRKDRRKALEEFMTQSSSEPEFTPDFGPSEIKLIRLLLNDEWSKLPKPEEDTDDSEDCELLDDDESDPEDLLADDWEPLEPEKQRSGSEIIRLDPSIFPWELPKSKENTANSEDFELSDDDESYTEDLGDDYEPSLEDPLKSKPSTQSDGEKSPDSKVSICCLIERAFLVLAIILYAVTVVFFQYQRKMEQYWLFIETYNIISILAARIRCLQPISNDQQYSYT